MNCKGPLIFEEWFEKEEGFLLPKVWVMVSKIGKMMRQLLILWATGSMLGSTQTVDMEMTRKNDFGRTLSLSLIQYILIPAQLDVVTGDHYFELKFELEKVGIYENGEEVEIDHDNKEDEDNGGNGYDLGDKELKLLWTNIELFL